METRANYIAVGAFALAAIVAVFTLLYWMGKYGDGEDLVPVNFRIQGSVSGLSKGSTVQFNGITIGRVTGLSLDADPQFVIVHAEIQSAAPVRRDTRATIGVRGLSGGAFIQLEGGDRESPSLFEVAAGEDAKVPMIQGDPAALADLMTRVGAIAARTERVMGTLEKFVSTNNATVSNTLNNVETFSKALAANSEGVGKFMNSAGNVAIALERLTKQLDGSVDKVEGILAAVEPQKITNTVTNIEQFSKSLADQRTQLTTVMSGVSQTVVELNKVSVQLSTTLGKVDGVVSSVDPTTIKTIVDGIGNTVERTEKIVAGIDTEKVSSAVDSVSAAAKSAEKTIAALDATALNGLVTDLSKTGAKLNQVLEAVDPNEVKTIVDGIGNTVVRAEKLVAGTENIVAGIDAEKVSGAVDSISAAAKSAEKTIAAMDADAINGLVTDLSKTGAKLNQLLEAVDPNGINVAVTNISKAAEGAQSMVTDAQGVVADVKKVTSTLSTRGSDINQIVTNASQLTSRLNESSKKIDGILSRVDNLLGDGGNSGLATEAQATLVEVRKAARSLSSSVNRISNNVDSFTRRGLGDVQGLVSDARRSINSIDRVMRNIENNPSSLITGAGGSSIRETSGGRVRR